MTAEAVADSQALPVFEVRGLTKVYVMGEVEVHALRGIDLDIHQGELIVILGHSGSGKSTLLNILGGLDTPTAGTVHYKDQDLTSADESALTRFRRHSIGFIFQLYNLVPSLTARENVELVTEIADDPMDAVDALALVGLGDRVDHFPSQMSGGEQQRIAIARAIAKKPDVLLCDEPTGALDIATGVKVLEALETVNKDLGTTVAVITHNAAIAEMSHRVLSMADGRIVRQRIVETQLTAGDIEW